MKSKAVSVVVVSLTVAVLLFSPVYTYAQCGEPGNEPCELYRTVLYSEPDWCTYQFGDRVFVRSHLVGVMIVDYQWYVLSADDPGQQQLAQQFAGDGWSVDWYVVGGCQVVLLP
jgi:hypothetical protein